MNTSPLDVVLQWAARLRRRLSSPLGRNVTALTLSSAVVNGLAMMQGFLAARWLGPAGYGTALLIVSFPEFVFTLLEPRSFQATVRYGSEQEQRGSVDGTLAVVKTGYLVDTAVAVTAFAVVVVLNNFAARLFGYSHMPGELVIGYAVVRILFRPLVPSSRAILVMAGKFKLIALLDTGTTAIRVVMVALLLALGAGPAGVVIGLGLESVMLSVAYLVAGQVEARRRWGRSPFTSSLSSITAQRREIIRFLILNNITRSLGVLRRADTLVVGALVGPGGAAFYKLGRNVAGLPRILTTSLEEVVYPEMVRSESSQAGSAMGPARRLTGAVGVPLGALTLLGAAALPFVIPVLLGDSYRPAGITAALLFAGAGGDVFLFVLRPLYLATDRIRTWTALNAAAAAALLPGFMLITWRMGIHGGAAYAATIDTAMIVTAAWLIRPKAHSSGWRAS